MLELERSEDWESELQQYIESVRGVPFEYGEHDCCCFISGAIESMTGVDPMQEFRGRYDSLKTSIRALRDIGEGDLEKTLDAKFPVVEPAQAKRGDLALFYDSVGVVTGRYAWFVSDEDLERIPISDWDKAWSVG